MFRSHSSVVQCWDEGFLLPAGSCHALENILTTGTASQVIEAFHAMQRRNRGGGGGGGGAAGGGRSPIAAHGTAEGGSRMLEELAAKSG